MQPEFVELLFIRPPTPAPRFVEPEKDRAARADELLQHERMLLAAALGHVVLVNREHFRGRLAAIALRIPEERLKPAPDLLGFGRIGAEPEERMRATRRGEQGLVRLGDGGIFGRGPRRSAVVGDDRQGLGQGRIGERGRAEVFARHKQDAAALHLHEVRQILHGPRRAGQGLRVEVAEDDYVVFEELIAGGEVGQGALVGLGPAARCTQEYRLDLDGLVPGHAFRFALHQHLGIAEVVARIAFHEQHAGALGLDHRDAPHDAIVGGIGFARDRRHF